jgi:2-iminobutanoate/2-iminopropanoate deaminase
MIQTISTAAGQHPIGPYAQAIRANGFIFCSGHAGVDPKTDTLVEGLEGQTRQVLNNLQAVLAEAGSDLSQVVQVTVFLRHMDDYARMNAVYEERFGAHRPARTTVAVSELAKRGALVVMDLIAVAP